MNRRVLAAATIALLFTALLAGALFFYFEPANYVLEPELSQERESPGKAVHLYRFSVEPGWFIRIYLEQKGADLSMRLDNPIGETVYTQDGKAWNHGGELICFIAREQGVHVLEVKAGNPNERGRYRLTLTVVKKPENRELIQAKAYESGALAMSLSKERSEEAYLKALEQFEEAIAAWRRADEREQVALTLLEMANLWAGLLRKDRQIDCLQRAASIFEAMEKKENAGFVYHNLGSAYYRISEYEQAIRYLNRALVFRTSPNRDRAETLRQLALAHLVLGRTTTFEITLKEARNIYRDLNDNRGLATTYRQNGIHLLHENQPGRAIEMFERALELIDTDDPFKLTIFNELGKALIGEHRSEEALKVYTQALDEEMLRKERNSDWIVNLKVGMSEALIDLGGYAEASGHLRTALKTYEAAGKTEEQVFVLFLSARAERGAGHLEKALEYMESAIVLSDTLRARAKSLNIRAHYVSTRYFYHEFYLSLLMAMGDENPIYRRKAFLYLERIRARNLLDALARGSIELETGNQPELASRARELQLRLATLTWAKSREATPDEYLKDGEIIRLLEQYDRVLGELRFPGERSDLSFPELSIDDIQKSLLDEETVLLLYAFGEKYTWLWLVDRDRFESFKLAPRRDVEADARELYKRLRHRDVFRFRQRVTEVSGHMTRYLLEPVADLIQNRRLLISADGALKYIPFGALPAPGAGDRPLALDHEIVYVHSMKTLAALRERTRTHDREPGEIVIFASPAFHVDSKFKDLPQTAEEARTIAELAPHGARVYQGYQATKAKVLDGACSNARIIHFATHGLLNLDRSELSALALAGTDSDGNPIDGFLRSYEIQGMDLSADLVVLSSCESALGKCMLGEGLVGLPQTFLEAGARGVLVSLWELEDLAAREFMKFFYGHLFSEGKGALAALRHAQTAMRKSDRWRDPYYWSGFVFLGDWRTFPK